MLSPDKERRLIDGLVIPAHPLALTAERQLDELHQRGLTRYYLDSGAGGVAVGVHTTQFAIHHSDVVRYERVLELSTIEANEHPSDPVLVAGVMGPTAQAVSEAETAAQLGYDLALVILPGWGQAPEEEILEGVARVGEILPVFAFYLQSAVTGREFDYAFWRRYFEIPAVKAVKIAPFDRYRTIDVVRAVVDAGRADEVALYTGNDDNIVVDLLTPYTFGATTVHIVGGLLGHWAVWTPAAVALHAEAREVVRRGGPVPLDLLARAVHVTEANAALFDKTNGYAGAIAGVSEVLARQGLLAGVWCLDDRDRLSPGQSEELDRILASYPEMREEPGLHVHEEVG